MVAGLEAVAIAGASGPDIGIKKLSQGRGLRTPCNTKLEAQSVPISKCGATPKETDHYIPNLLLEQASSDLEKSYLLLFLKRRALPTPRQHQATQ